MENRFSVYEKLVCPGKIDPPITLFCRLIEVESTEGVLPGRQDSGFVAMGYLEAVQ